MRISPVWFASLLVVGFLAVGCDASSSGATASSPVELEIVQGAGVDLVAGEKIELELEGVSASEVDWTSSDTNVATITQDGLVTAHAAGSSTMTASLRSDPGETASIVITVGLRTFATISAGGEHSLALDEVGNAWAWGNNEVFQLGDGGTGTNQADPERVVMPDGVTFTTIAAGEHHSVALDDDGNPWAWGQDDVGQLGNGEPNTNKNTPVRVTMPDRVTFTTIAAGNDHTLAIDESGAAWAWGENGLGQLGTGDSGIPIGEPHNIRVSPVSVVMPTGVRFTALGAGQSHSVALDEDGNAWTWGDNGASQLGNGEAGWSEATPTPVVMPDGVTFSKISVGTVHSLALDEDGNAWAWGSDFSGQLGDGGTNADQATPVPVVMPDGTRFTAIYAGGFHSLALDQDGNAWTWGDNGMCQLGINESTQKPPVTTPTPVAVPDGVRFTSIYAGGYHSLALDEDGNLWAWGSDYSGQLGDGGVIENSVWCVPAQVEKP